MSDYYKCQCGMTLSPGQKRCGRANCPASFCLVAEPDHAQTRVPKSRYEEAEVVEAEPPPRWWPYAEDPTYVVERASGTTTFVRGVARFYGDRAKQRAALFCAAPYLVEAAESAMLLVERLANGLYVDSPEYRALQSAVEKAKGSGS